jgi:hypothetical protein
VAENLAAGKTFQNAMGDGDGAPAKPDPKAPTSITMDNGPLAFVVEITAWNVKPYAPALQFKAGKPPRGASRSCSTTLASRGSRGASRMSP